MSIFWNTVLSVLDEKGLNKSELHAGINKSKTTVYHWIKRDTLPQADDALLIADYLGVSVRYLVTGRDDEQPSQLMRKLIQACDGMSEAMLLKMISEAQDLKILMYRQKTAEEDTSGSVSG